MSEREAIARRFHDLYEQHAPEFGYATRADTKAFDPDTPNGRLMTKVCGIISDEIYRAGLEQAALICENLTFGISTDDWMRLTEKGFVKRACRECAAAIRKAAE